MTVEKLAEEYALKQVPNPNPNDAPYTTTGDIYESIKDAFIEGYKAASSNTVAPVDNIRWVKASERLPNDDSVKHIRHKLGSDFWIPNIGYYRKTKHWFECDRGRQIFEIDKIEWLEEQTNPVDNIQSEENDWNVGDEFTTPETGEQIFTVKKVHKYDVEANDSRSRSGETLFSKSYITKVSTNPLK